MARRPIYAPDVLNQFMGSSEKTEATVQQIRIKMGLTVEQSRCFAGWIKRHDKGSNLAEGFRIASVGKVRGRGGSRLNLYSIKRDVPHYLKRKY